MGDFYRGISNGLCKESSLSEAEGDSSPGVGELLAKGEVWEGGEGAFYSRDVGELPFPTQSSIHSAVNY